MKKKKKKEKTNTKDNAHPLSPNPRPNIDQTPPHRIAPIICNKNTMNKNGILGRNETIQLIWKYKEW